MYYNKGQVKQPYFVDKTELLSELFPFLERGNTHICITRPRRFGKTVISMINIETNMMEFQLISVKCQEIVLLIQNI